MDIKILFYTCITNYYMGRQSEEHQKWGQCLAYYTLSLEKLQECEKLAKVNIELKWAIIFGGLCVLA